MNINNRTNNKERINIINTHLHGFNFKPTHFISLIPKKYQNVEWKVKQRIGNNSAYGQVYSIDLSITNCKKDIDQMYVVKYVKFTNNKAHKISFQREVAVGSTVGIGNVGPKIYMYFYTDEYGLYVMDNLMEGLKGHRMKSLYDYLNSYHKNVCPRINSLIYTELQLVLRKFYKLGYYHGDLHFGNIAVIYTPDKKKIKVKIFDYGATQLLSPLSVNLNNDCIETILLQIHHQFQTKCNTISFTNRKKIIKVGNETIAKTHGQYFKSNANEIYKGLGPKRYNNFKKSLKYLMK